MAFRAVGSLTEGGASGGTSSITGLSFARPTYQENDIILLVASGDADVTGLSVTWPSGFTEIAIPTVGNDGHTLIAAWKLATASEPTTYSADLSASSGTFWLQRTAALSFSGRDATPNIVLLSGNDVNSGGLSRTVSNSGITLPAAGYDLVFMAGSDQVTAPGTHSWTPPSGYTERVDANLLTSAWGSFHIATLDNASSGATGTVSASVSSDTSQLGGYVTLLIGIEPAATTSPHARMSLLGIG